MPDTIARSLQDATEQLKPVSETARLDSEILLAFVLNENRSYLYTWPDKELTREHISLYNALLQRRATGEPIAYIVGEQEFWSLRLKVTPDTLIPRPETELLVELALERLAPAADKNILDLGTGSGAIALALARERPHCHITGIDQSRQALLVAQENARTLVIRNVHFQHGHWCRALISGQRYDIIVANPPYIACHDPHLCRGDVRFEPDSALSSGADGLEDICEIAASVPPFLTTDGWLLLEHGYQQGEAVTAILEALGYTNITGHHDLANLPRVVTAQHP